MKLKKTITLECPSPMGAGEISIIDALIVIKNVWAEEPDNYIGDSDVWIWRELVRRGLMKDVIEALLLEALAEVGRIRAQEAM